MIGFIACSSRLRSRTAALLLVFSALLPAAAQRTHTGRQNPQLADYFAGTAAQAYARAAAATATTQERAGHTALDAMIARFHATVDKAAGQGRPKANDQANGQLVVNLPQFLSAPQFDTTKTDTSDIYASAEGDFNGDGLPDIATLNQDGGVNVFLNSGNGVMKFAYTDATLPAAGLSNMLQLAIGDLNGDGFADIVGLDQRNDQVAVWLSNGDGTLAKPVTYPVTPTSGASFFYGGGGIALADVTGDGHLDLVAATADYENGNPRTILSLQVFAGKGDGTFAAPTESDTTLSDIYFMVWGDTLLLADINGDGAKDAVLMLNDGGLNSTAGLGVMTAKGDGKGGFGALSGYTGAFVAGAVNHYATSNMAVADLNQDGVPDVIFNDGSGTLWVALNPGSGSFAAGTSVLTNNANLVFRIGDLNGDKLPDLVTFQNNMVSTYLGNGDATFSTTPHVYPGGLEPGHQQPALAGYTSTTNKALGAVYVSEELPVATLLTGNGDGTLQAAPILFPPSENVENIAVFASGDVNGDGIPDFMAFDYTNANAANNPNRLPAIISMISDGKGGIKTSVTAIPDSFFIGKNPTSVLVEPMATDLNGDGKPDLLFSLGHDLEIALGNGDGTFQTPQVLNLVGAGFPTLDCPPGLASAGKGSDGVTEFVVAYGGDSACGGSGGGPSGVFAFTYASGQINSIQANFIPLGSSLIDAKLSDINSDGVLDLVTNDADETTNTAAVYVTRGIGPGAFDPNQTNVVEAGNHISGILTGDYNGDGKPDLVLTDLGDGTIGDGTGGVLLLAGNNDGTFGSITRVDGGMPIEAAAWGDFNGDGYPDLALSQFLGRPLDPFQNRWRLVYTFAVMPNAGDGTFPVSEPYGEFSQAQVFVGDYNSDGSIDAAVPQTGVTMFLNTMPKPGYTLSNPASLSVVQGATGIATVTVAANSNFNGQVTLACTGAPAESSCTVNPATVTLSNGQTASFSVVLATTAPNNSYSAKSLSQVPSWTALACVFAIFIPGRKRLGRAFPVLLALLAISTVAALTGCSSSSPVKPSAPLYTGTPVGATSITITATSGALTQTVKLPFTVTAN